MTVRILKKQIPFSIRWIECPCYYTYSWELLNSISVLIEKEKNVDSNLLIRLGQQNAKQTREGERERRKILFSFYILNSGHFIIV